MFGVYSNQRLSENERKLLNSNPDDVNWYCVISQSIFRDGRPFQIRQDIELPQKDDDNGVVLIFEGGDVVYMKSIESEVTKEEFDSITEVCTYLGDKFKRPIRAYVPCAPFKHLDFDVEKNGRDITIIFSFLNVNDGEEIIDRLESKLKNHEEFTIPDSIDHMLLPYTGYKDREVFYEKLNNYMQLVEAYEFVWGRQIMFEYEKQNYEVKDSEDQLYYDVMFARVCGVYSPFEIDSEVDFPHREKLGGIILKFIGGGAGYFKVQSEMPSKKEIREIFEVCKFLQKSFGEYVVAYIICEPHIEIRNIQVLADKNIDMTFLSSRKNDGDKLLDNLIKKLERGESFTIDDYLQKFTIPFMSRHNNDGFQLKFNRLVELYNESDIEVPDHKDIFKSQTVFNRIF